MTATWIDSHAHLNDDRFADDLVDVISRATEAGVTDIVNIGTDVASSREVIRLAHAHAPLWAVIGVHPHNASSYGSEARAELTELSRDERVVALGEIGLDYHYDFSPRDVQQAAFADQLGLADALDLPIVIHCREALDDVFGVLDAHRRSPYRGVFHCFGGSADDAREVMSRGFDVSFTGPVTFKKADDVREAAQAVPPDRLLVETDCPYLTPVPKRGKRNEPAYVVHTARKLAELHGMSEAELSGITRENTLRLYSRMAANRS